MRRGEERRGEERRGEERRGEERREEKRNYEQPKGFSELSMSMTGTLIMNHTEP